MSQLAITSLPAVIDIRDWSDLRDRLGLKLVRSYWLDGEARPTLEVTVSAEVNNDGLRDAHALHDERAGRKDH